MSKPDFVYVNYIRASREEVWKGLLEPEFTRQYWMHEQISDWKVGSSWEHVRLDEAKTPDIVGKVLESDHPNRLVLTWAQPKDADNPEKVSKVAFDLRPVEEWPNGPWTQLTLTHSDLEPGSEMEQSVSYGWPALMSGLKTLLETGKI
ncbi:MAG: SRPBCC family protein [Candidatus Eisenbacteria bacterium]|uniref:SRPBCC family protein n=1 Tax=Eiseniibacteriota bacterium TaxID=2212470 RepID=A0A7Y2H3U0_UNCEI|nr:SRPBCC family protein [Candidatus Eisenbacteria bacterium]